MNYFLDNTLPPRLARALNVLVEDASRSRIEDHVLHLTEKFPPDTPDIDWINQLADAGDWVIIRGDVRIMRNAHERRAWQQSRLTAFFLKKGWSQQRFWLQAATLVRWWPDIMLQARKVAPGAGFLVPFKYNGKFEQPRLS